MMVSFSKEFSPFPKVIYVNYNAFNQSLPQANFPLRHFNEAGDMLAACYLSQPPLTEVGTSFAEL